eukprot:scaffold36344_cov14-Tisochrysis_lutea.AAC.1
MAHSTDQHAAKDPPFVQCDLGETQGREEVSRLYLSERQQPVALAAAAASGGGGGPAAHFTDCSPPRLMTRSTTAQYQPMCSGGLIITAGGSARGACMAHGLALDDAMDGQKGSSKTLTTSSSSAMMVGTKMRNVRVKKRQMNRYVIN